MLNHAYPAFLCINRLVVFKNIVERNFREFILYVVVCAPCICGNIMLAELLLSLEITS